MTDLSLWVMGIVHPCRDGCISYCWLREAKEQSINKYYCVLLSPFAYSYRYIYEQALKTIH